MVYLEFETKSKLSCIESSCLQLKQWFLNPESVGKHFCLSGQCLRIAKNRALLCIMLPNFNEELIFIPSEKVFLANYMIKNLTWYYLSLYSKPAHEFYRFLNGITIK